MPPLILGAGPAGCAAAIVLARSGARPLLIDRDGEAGDVLCGGFLSWATAERLRGIGIDAEALGAHRVERLLLFGSGRPAKIPLPRLAFSLSRRTLDCALRRQATEAGAELLVETIRQVGGLHVLARQREWRPESLFLATGKHDVRGVTRPRPTDDPALGIRLRFRPSATLARRLAGTIELHLFDGGYAGVVLQERGSANLCLAVRKSLLAESEGNPVDLLASLAAKHPHFALRLESGWREAAIETIGAVPYGWSAATTEAGLFRLGDQAAVIPSVAGEGIDIALASGIAAAEAWLHGGAAAAPGFQRRFHESVRDPMRWAGAAWSLAETPAAAQVGLAAARLVPGLIAPLMAATRIA
jgi:flavin-dependent dehydrogenase